MDPLDSHVLYVREKFAVALAVLDEYRGFRESDWELAGHLIEVSTATRDLCLSAMRQRQRDTTRARALETANASASSATASCLRPSAQLSGGSTSSTTAG